MALLGIFLSYLIGSVPFAYIFGRALKGIDIRKFGSGNVGATNAFRILGPLWGLLVLILDAAKGAITVSWVTDYFLNYTEISAEALRVIFGVSVVCGHNWSLFLRLRGGKGVATALGVLFGLALVAAELRPVLLAVILVWLIIFLAIRFVSIASVLSALSFPVFVLIFHPSKELLILAIVLAGLVVFRHKKNIADILANKEQPLQFKRR